MKQWFDCEGFMALHYRYGLPRIDREDAGPPAAAACLSQPAACLTFCLVHAAVLHFTVFAQFLRLCNWSTLQVQLQMHARPSATHHCATLPGPHTPRTR